MRKFPTQETHLAKIISDSVYRQKFHAQLKQYNHWIVGLYRAGILPLFGAGRTVMLLTTLGRKSQRLRSTPIGYFRIGEMIYLFSAWGKSSSWYKNLLAAPDQAWIQIGLRKWPVKAEILEDPGEIHQTLAQFLSESPKQAAVLFGWDPEHDRLANADFSLVIEKVLIVRFHRLGD